MRGIIKRLCAIACGLAAFAAQQAAAQTMSQLPPLRPLYDANNVSLSNGLSARFTGPSISVGPGGAGGLAFQYNYTEVGSSWGYWANPYTIKAELYTGTNIVTVLFPDHTETFDTTSSTTDVPSQQETGALFTLAGSGGDSEYRAPDGTLIVLYMLSSTVGELKYIQSPNGERVTPIWKGTGADRRLQSVNNNFGYQIKLEYASNSPGNPDYTKLARAVAINTAVEYCDPSADTCSVASSWPTLTYANPSSGVYTATDNLSRVTTLTLSSGIITSVQDPVGTTTYARASGSPPGPVTSVTKGSDMWTYTATYVPSTHYYYRVTNPEGYVSEVGINVTTFLKRYEIDPAGNQTDYSYTGQLLTLVTAPGGQTVGYGYDGRKNITSTTTTPTSGSPTVTYISYESSCTSGNVLYCNSPKTTTDALGNVTDYTYDATHGGVTTITLPSPDGVAARPEVRTTYAGFNAYVKNSGGSFVATTGTIYLPTAVKTCATGAGNACSGAANEIVSTAAYGSTGVANNLQPTSASTGPGNGGPGDIATAAMTYNAVGAVLTVDGPLSSTDTVYYHYDAYWRPVGVVQPDPDGGGALKPKAIRTAYDAIGNVFSQEIGTVNSVSDSPWDTNFIATAKTETAYDSRNRPIKTVQKNAAGTTIGVSQTSYNGASQVVCRARRLNSADFSSPPTACTQGTDTMDRITRQNYDAYGRLASVTEGLGTPLSYTTQTTTYLASGDGKGQVGSVSDGNNNKTSYAYDPFGRSWKVFYPDPSTPGTSSTTDYEEMTYDANGNRTGGRLRDATSVSITYDNLNRMTVDLEGGTYAYDNLGRVTSTTKFTRTSTFAYDAFDNMLSETTGLGAVSYQYDLAGRRTRLIWPDSVYVTYDWDDASNLTAIKLSGSTSLASFGYDSLGRRTSLTRGNGTSSSYSYDDRSSLTGFGLDLASSGNDQTVALTRDAFGRITVKAGTNNTYDMAPPGAWTGGTDYNPNGLNQIATAGGLTFSYDGRGNTTSNGSDSFTYDTGNRMTGMNSGTVALAYDAPGRLYEHTASGTTTRYQYDKADLITEYNTGGTVQRRYVHGPRTDEPLVWFEGTGTGTPHYLMADERGSIVAVTDGSGAAEAINTYDEYGAPATTSATYASRFRYTGQVWFGDLDLYYFKARMYDPSTGRFVQADPIGYGDGLNMYAYAGNDPINGVDPSGTEINTSPEELVKCGETILERSKCDVLSDVVVRGKRKKKNKPNPIVSFFAELFGGGGGGPNGMSGEGLGGSSGGAGSQPPQNEQSDPDVDPTKCVTGRTVMPGAEAQGEYTRNPFPGSYLVVSHGTSGGMTNADLTRRYTIGELKKSMEANGYKRGQPITLAVCSAGSSYPNIPSKLARDYGATVYAVRDFCIAGGDEDAYPSSDEGGQNSQPWVEFRSTFFGIKQSYVRAPGCHPQ